MKNYKLMRTDYVTDCVYQTNDKDEMKNKILQIMTENYKNCYYALSGIDKYKENFYEGAWIEVYEDGNKIQEVSIEKGWELK